MAAMKVCNGSILIVDDDPMISMNHVDILEDADYACTAATNLAQAQALCHNRNFDLILCDHDLTDGQGTALLEWLLTHGKTTPVLYLSAAQPAVLEKVKASPLVRDVLVKPVHERVLLEEVRTYLQPSRQQIYPRLIGEEERQLILDELF